MSRASRRKAAKSSKNLKPVSFMAMAVTCGVFIGFGLGALAGNVIMLTIVGFVVGLGAGFLIDKRNGVPYTRAKH